MPTLLWHPRLLRCIAIHDAGYVYHMPFAYVYSDGRTQGEGDCTTSAVVMIALISPLAAAVISSYVSAIFGTRLSLLFSARSSAATQSQSEHWDAAWDQEESVRGVSITLHNHRVI